MLQQFDFEAMYLPGKDNVIADYLSRDAALAEKLEETRWEMMVIETNTIHDAEILALRQKQQRETFQKDDAIIPKRSARLASKPQYNFNEKDMFNLNNYGISKKQNAEVKLIPDNDDIDEAELQKISAEEQAENIAYENKLNKNKLLQSVKRDKEYRQIQARCKKANKYIKFRNRKWLKNDEGIIFTANKNNHMVPLIPKAMQQDMLQYFHTANVFHHQGVDKMSNNISHYAYWPAMRQDIKKYCGECDSCHSSKIKREKAQGKIQQFPATKPFQQIAIDIVGYLPTTNEGNRYLLTIIDGFTRFVTAIPLKSISAVAVARAFVNHWIYIYGPPKYVLSDNGTQFKSNTFRAVAKLLGLKQQFTTVDHPECNGMIERFHRYLKERLKFKALDHGLDYYAEDDWDIHIASICASHNIAVHSSTGYAPFELLFGKRPMLPLLITQLNEEDCENIPITDYDEYLKTFIHQLNALRRKANKIDIERIGKAIRRLNATRKEFSFQKGELVMKYIGNRMVGTKKKLSEEWDGPHEIIKILDNGVDFVIKDTRDENQIQTIHGKWLAYHQKWKSAKLKTIFNKRN